MTQASLGIQEYVALRETKETEDFVALQVDLGNSSFDVHTKYFPGIRKARESHSCNVFS